MWIHAIIAEIREGWIWDVVAGDDEMSPGLAASKYDAIAAVQARVEQLLAERIQQANTIEIALLAVRGVVEEHLGARLLGETVHKEWGTWDGRMRRYRRTEGTEIENVMDEIRKFVFIALGESGRCLFEVRAR